MTTLENILAALVIAITSAILGKFIGEKHKVGKDTCEQYRISCNSLISTKLANIEEKIDSLTKAVNIKIFGL